jgi:hypothetical protein
MPITDLQVTGGCMKRWWRAHGVACGKLRPTRA